MYLQAARAVCSFKGIFNSWTTILSTHPAAAPLSPLMADEYGPSTALHFNSQTRENVTLRD